MAAEREQGAIDSAMEAAITQSDNDAAEQVWASLGDPETAKVKVEAILRDEGDPTTVQSQRVRAGFTAFGQTIWSLQDQSIFLANAACDGRAAPVLDLMHHVSSGQSWGLGQIPGSLFKGGWGPGQSGSYLVRQFGVISAPRGDVSVAIAVEPSSGSFDEGTQALTAVADWLSDNVESLPAGRC